MRVVYLNGSFLAEEEAHISPFDRGFLFADAVYEVTSVIEGRLIDFDGHWERLQRSLGMLRMGVPLDRETLLGMHRQLVSRNGIDEGLIYLQVTRGVADRDFAFPPEGTAQTVFAMTQAKSLINNPVASKGMKVVTIDDLRWDLCDVKTVQLLYPSLAKMEAKGRGADDAWFVRDGYVTEGTSNNTYIVTDDGEIVTRDLSHAILHGITRKAVLAAAARLGYRLVERAFTPEEAEGAREAFISSAGTFVLPVVSVNGHTLGNGTPGPVAEALRAEYIRVARETAI